MDIYRIALMLSTLLCSLVAGFLFAFTIVVMPGIKSLNEHNFLQAFKVMDRVIQNKQPLFIVVWLGSVVVLVAAAWFGFSQLAGLDRLLILTACATYLFGVQLPTMTINIPLNKQLQKQNLNSMTAPALRVARTNFEPRWIQWNAIRTVLSILTSVLLIILVSRI
jgi:uncharacterized membrane protein